MSDSLERLYQAVIAAKDLDPAVSRTAKLFQHGPTRMAKKLAEEAIEVVIDAVSGKPDAVVRESADLLYNLTVLWASAGIQPEDVWREMQRREQMLGIAEKLPKSAVKAPKAAPARTLSDRASSDRTSSDRASPDKAPPSKPLSTKPLSTKTLRPEPALAEAAASRVSRRPIVALEGRALRKRR
jgi:phosphoribosyl-ATP pyrophosphohydrolase